MVDAIGSALSGLRAASTRISVSANNLANQQSTSTRVGGQVLQEPFRPQRVEQVSQSTGGVLARVRDASPATIKVYDPTSPAANSEGLVELPNVDTATELVNQRIATYDYKANLTSIKAQDDLQQSLLDIFT
ncbi:MAG: flagellar basal body rod protein FlgC [Alphaproteobacteria bacterium]